MKGNKKPISYYSAHREKGAALIVSLLILMVLTMLGITTMSTSSMEERMAGNSRDHNLAFQAAESALKYAEEIYMPGLANPSLLFEGNYAGLYGPTSDPTQTTWSASDSIAYNGSISGLASQPRFVVQLIKTNGSEDINISGYGESAGLGSVSTYRITARGTGGTDKAVVTLQTYYGL